MAEGQVSLWSKLPSEMPLWQASWNVIFLKPNVDLDKLALLIH